MGESRELAIRNLDTWNTGCMLDSNETREYPRRLGMNGGSGSALAAPGFVRDHMGPVLCRDIMLRLMIQTDVCTWRFDSSYFLYDKKVDYAPGPTRSS